MGRQRAHPRHRGEGGFSLIELLVVIALIGMAVLVGYPLALAFHVAWSDHRADIQIRMRCFLLLAGAVESDASACP